MNPKIHRVVSYLCTAGAASWVVIGILAYPEAEANHAFATGLLYLMLAYLNWDFSRE